MSKKELKRTKLFDKLLAIENKLKKNKPLYDERDNIFCELANLGLGVFEYSGKEFIVQDNFSNKNKAFKVAGVNRFEVKVKEIKIKK